MINRVKVPFTQEEYSALLEMSVVQELRSPAEQIRFIIRQELVRRGLLPAPTHTNEREFRCRCIPEPETHR
jgi:hypothetical protein